MINRPLKIPGKRRVLTKNMIITSQENTKSASEASRWLGVSYNTYKKWAKYYNVFEQHLNQSGKGIKKGWGSYKISMEDILNGSIKNKYSLRVFKKRLVSEGYSPNECSICGWNEEGLLDKLICLNVDFLDGNVSNGTYDNIRLLCPNCYLSNNGYFHRSKVFCK